MGGIIGGISKLFKKPKTPSIPPPPPPPPPPSLPPLEPPPAVEDVTGAGEAERRKLRRKSGRKQTFITGDLIPQTTKKAVLG